MFYIKAGVAFNSIHFKHEDRAAFESKYMKAGEAIDFGYSHYVGQSTWYMGVELGCTSRGVRYKDSFNNESSLIYHGIKCAPLLFGNRAKLAKDLYVDAHFAGFFTGYYRSKPYNRDYNVMNAGFEAGIALWTLNRVCVELAYQIGFCNVVQKIKSSNHNIQVKLGLAL